MSKELIDAITDMREEDAVKIAEQLLNSGADPLGVLADCREALGVIGSRFAAGECFVPELILAGEMLRQISTLAKPMIAGTSSGPKEKLGRIVIGTVEGDIHDIGKDIVVGMLKATGYEVLDLGVDVPVEKIVAAVRDSGAKVVGLSGLITLSFDSMKATIAALDAAGLRKDIKVMVGGGSLTEMVREYVGADALGADAQAAVSLCNQWL